MRYLFDDWEALRESLRGKHVCLFLDYDGTLVPIADSPDKAVLSPQVRGLMKAFLETSDCNLAVISGRALSEVRGLVGLDGIIYAGNHGMEMEGPGIVFEPGLPANARDALDAVRADLEERLAGVTGVLVEDKGLTIAVHYRLAEAEDAERVKRIFSEATGPGLLRGSIRTSPGKKVLEVRPPLDWDKGKAVSWILARWQGETGRTDGVPVYVGDDVTDEDAFGALPEGGVSVLVGGPRESRASHYLRGPEEVRELLLRLVNLREGNARHQSPQES